MISSPEYGRPHNFRNSHSEELSRAVSGTYSRGGWNLPTENKKLWLKYQFSLLNQKIKITQLFMTNPLV